jgi:hypothetical protein
MAGLRSQLAWLVRGRATRCARSTRCRSTCASCSRRSTACRTRSSPSPPEPRMRSRTSASTGRAARTAARRARPRSRGGGERDRRPVRARRCAARPAGRGLRRAFVGCATMMDDSPEARVARWTERDAAIGAHAEVEQLRAVLAERDREVANLRERAAQLAHNVMALQLERTASTRCSPRFRLRLRHRHHRRSRAAPARSPGGSCVASGCAAECRGGDRGIGDASGGLRDRAEHRHARARAWGRAGVRRRGGSLRPRDRPCADRGAGRQRSRHARRRH